MVKLGKKDKSLLENSFKNIYERDEKGRTALHYAVEVKTVRLLIEKGVDVNAADVRGHTALHLAKMKTRTTLLQKLKEVFRSYKSQPIGKVIQIISPILRGWTNYFRIGNSGRSYKYIKQWVEKKARRNLMQARKAKGFGWKRWSSKWIYETLGLYSDCRIRYYVPKALPAQYAINFGKESTRKA